MNPHWWQNPDARAELECVLGGLDTLRASPPRGQAAYFCDLCEILTSLLDAATSFAVSEREKHDVHEHRSRLDRRLAATTYVERQAIETLEHFEEALISSLLGEPEKKLAVYGTLAEHGYPALAWRPGGPRVPARLFFAPDMARHWRRLDEFEGDGYRRILVPVEDEGGVVAVANLYADRAAAEGR